MSGWGLDEADIEEAGDDEEDGGFAAELQRAIDNGTIAQLDLATLGSQLSEVSDAELLSEAQAADPREKAGRYYESRLEALDAGSGSEGEGSADPEAAEERIREAGSLDESPDSEGGEALADGAEELMPEATDGLEEHGSEPESPPSTANGSAPDYDSLPDTFMSRREAVEKDSLQRWLVWGREGLGKTHFGLSMPEPVAVIDTEGKAHDIAEKFEKELAIAQPADYAEAVEAVRAAKEWLQTRLEATGQRGTIVVDSMSIMWEWAQQEYVDRYYDMKESPAEVDFSSAMEKGADDWQEIKKLHNENFRARLLDSDFHLCLTAMATEDYGAVLEGSQSKPPDKPDGEKDNPYKVNHVLHIEEGRDGEPRATLEKCGLSQFSFAGLAWPTYPTAREIIDALRDAEEAPEPVDPDEVTAHDVVIHRGRAGRGAGGEE